MLCSCVTGCREGEVSVPLELFEVLPHYDHNHEMKFDKYFFFFFSFTNERLKKRACKMSCPPESVLCGTAFCWNKQLRVFLGMSQWGLHIMWLKFSSGFISGPWLGHSGTWICFVLNHLCLGLFSFWQVNHLPQSPAFWRLQQIFLQLFPVFCSVHLFFPTLSSLSLLMKCTPGHDVATTMFDNGDGAHRVMCSATFTPYKKRIGI